MNEILFDGVLWGIGKASWFVLSRFLKNLRTPSDRQYQLIGFLVCIPFAYLIYYFWR